MCRTSFQVKLKLKPYLGLSIVFSDSSIHRVQCKMLTGKGMFLTKTYGDEAGMVGNGLLGQPVSSHTKIHHYSYTFFLIKKYMAQETMQVL